MKLLPGAAIAWPFYSSGDTFGLQVLIWPLFLAWLFLCAVGYANPLTFTMVVFRRKILPEIGASVILAQAVFLAALIAGIWFVILAAEVFKW